MAVGELVKELVHWSRTDKMAKNDNIPRRDIDIIVVDRILDVREESVEGNRWEDGTTRRNKKKFLFLGENVDGGDKFMPCLRPDNDKTAFLRMLVRTEPYRTGWVV